MIMGWKFISKNGTYASYNEILYLCIKEMVNYLYLRWKVLNL